ncbi:MULTISPECIES: CvpA family protein [Arcobacteraceae]|jgi:membrane protein required for colicin V production|uniref:Colicin V production protein n=3 Tax=Aliarcobacter butzleri TaxID=28197 RepID=A8ESJ6_ALIB4|nr:MULTISPECIES: CvpA family protein [Arcobacteraceae]ABV66920.1 colicin V production protein [Aliarcobacter butzleri RM4018]KLE04654.1 colicin V synthesis protein [Aliarcobacter butzleri L353]MCG3657303.1 CvpA family protein [Aliarcobacter butzleri]MCG3664085.1 CvpA family protein [Aliarcobacter butzleri]MCG3674626.1 CvpA family protein [Aliarcobacter butzleri]
MQNIAIFDLVIITITLLLGLKGLFRGIIKEIFGIIGIIGAIFVASRISTQTGELIAPVLVLENQATIKLIGFVIALVIVWLIAYSAGVVVSKIFSASGLGIIDRFFGFLFGMAKIFLIFSVIAYALYQVNSFKKVIDEQFKTSILMPYLLDVGSVIIKLDTTALTNNIDKAIETVTDTPSTIQNTTQEIKQEVDSTLNNVQEVVEDGVKDAVEEEVKTTKDKLKDIANKNENNQ